MTVLGVSNVSFGLPPPARKVLNSVFLHEAVAAGLSAAIVDVAKIVPFHEIPPEERTPSLGLLHNRTATALEDFIAHFKSARETAAPEAAEAKAHEEAVSRKVVAGDRDGLEDALAVLLARMPAEAIINQVLVPAMRHVGELFGRGIDGSIAQEHRGSRYGFGYPACPDLEAHVPLFKLLDPARIGVALTENMQMVPEFSTSALVAHRPQAKYFAV